MLHLMFICVVLIVIGKIFTILMDRTIFICDNCYAKFTHKYITEPGKCPCCKSSPIHKLSRFVK